MVRELLDGDGADLEGRGDGLDLGTGAGVLWRRTVGAGRDLWTVVAVELERDVGRRTVGMAVGVEGRVVGRERGTAVEDPVTREPGFRTVGVGRRGVGL